MAGGGARPGAGRRPSGVSLARRRLVAGIERGLAEAARQAGCALEAREELVEESVSQIALAMIQAGQGADLVKLYAATVYRDDPGEAAGDEGGGSALERAMQRLPGLRRGTVSAQSGGLDLEHKAESEGYGRGASDTVSDAPENRARQRPLLPGQGSLLDGLSGRPIVGEGKQ